MFLSIFAAVTIGFSQVSYEVEEEDENGDGNTVEICINRIGYLERSVTVYLSTIDGSAEGNCKWDLL